MLGNSKLVVEHGQPPWSDERLAQMAQGIAPGAAWRMGSEGMTTLKVIASPIFFGNQMIKPGRYGLNLLRAGENDWNFILFEPKHEAEGAVQIGPDEPPTQIVAKYSSDAAEKVAALTVDLVKEGEGANCVLAWGPLRVTAPMSAVEVTTIDLDLNGNEAKSSWYCRPLAADTDLTKPTIAGTLDVEIDDEECSMNIYFMQEGGNLVALLRNKEREAAEIENAGLEQVLKQFEAAIQQFGAQAEAQVGPARQQTRRRMMRNELTLEESTTRPDNLKFSAAAEDAAPGKLSCELFQTRGSVNIEVVFGGKKAVIRVDESAFALKPSS